MPDAQGYSTPAEIERERAAMEAQRGRVPAFMTKPGKVVEGSPLPENEQNRLRDLDPEERGDEAWFNTHPVAGTVTTGQQEFGERSPFPDEMERLTEGRYRYAFEFDAEGIPTIVPGTVEEVATGKRITMEVLKARRVLEMAEQ